MTDPMTEDEALAYVDRLRAQLAAANARADVAEARLAKIAWYADAWTNEANELSDLKSCLQEIEKLARSE